LQCTDDDNRSYRNVCNMSLISFSLAVIFIISEERFSTKKLVKQNFNFVPLILTPMLISAKCI